MNRNEDLMRRLSEEKTGSKADLLKSSFILFFLFITSQTLSQIPVNGFCLVENYPLTKDYRGVISADLNSDGNDELIFYSTLHKRIGIYSGFNDKNITLKEFQLNSEISQLKLLRDKSEKNDLFVAVERKSRRISLLHISPDAVKASNSYIEFDSYPENVFTGDIDLDGKEEILVSGSGFDGLSILFRANGGIGESKIITGTSFSEAIFFDLNDDGYPDVLAFNILENSLHYFINNTRGLFRLSRTVPYSEKINFLQSHDLNQDGFPDIVYAVGRQIEILLGDFQFAFSKKKNIMLQQRPAGIISADFNRDRFPDLAYLLTDGTLNIMFGKNNSDFHRSISYMHYPSITGFTNFRTAVGSNITLFSEKGEMKVLQPINELNGNMKLVPSFSVGAVQQFDNGHNNVPDIIFVDEYDNYLKLFISNAKGIPTLFYDIPLADDHKEIVVDDFFKHSKSFYCYSEDTPLLEVFKYDFKTNKLNRKQLYAPGEILDLALQRIDSSHVNIFVAYTKNSKLYLGKFEDRELSITFKEYPFIDRNVSLARLLFFDEPVIHYWKVEKELLHFKSAKIKAGRNDYEIYFEIPAEDGAQIYLYGTNYYYSEYPSVVSIVKNEISSYLMLLKADKFYISDRLFRAAENEKKEFGRGFFGETSISGIIDFIVISSDDNYINKLFYSEKDKRYLLRRMFAVEDVSDYFFARLNKKNYFFVYSTKKEGHLFITSLRKYYPF